MESLSNNEEVLDDDIEIITKGISLAEYSQMHPYQYLKQLNNIYQNCNKSSTKDYSSASMVKLPWKKFKPVAIPKVFEENYNIERKDIYVSKNLEESQKSEEQQKERKFWKQHEELMKKYYKSNIANNNMKKKVLEQRRKNLLSAKSYSNITNVHKLQKVTKQSNQFNHTSFVDNFSNKENCNNDERASTAKTQSDQNDSKIIADHKNPIIQKQRKLLVDNVLLKDKSHIYLKKIMLKGTDLTYDQNELKQEVLEKLKKISTMQNYNRAKTANNFQRRGNKSKEKHLRRQAINKAPINSASLRESRVRERQYLELYKEEELINRYKQKIKVIDCSISQKNVKKTAEILKQMQEMASIRIEDY